MPAFTASLCRVRHLPWIYRPDNMTLCLIASSERTSIVACVRFPRGAPRFRTPATRGGRINDREPHDWLSHPLADSLEHHECSYQQRHPN